jgi:hypothetical protein
MNTILSPGAEYGSGRVNAENALYSKLKSRRDDQHQRQKVNEPHGSVPSRGPA